jgi:hypothetical protein
MVNAQARGWKGAASKRKSVWPRRRSPLLRPTGVGWVFQPLQARFEGLQLFPGALQNLRLDIELLAADEIEFAEAAGEQRTCVLVDIRSRTGSDEAAQSGAKFFENSGVEHGNHRRVLVSECVEFSTGTARKQARTRLVHATYGRCSIAVQQAAVCAAQIAQSTDYSSIKNLARNLLITG